MIDSIAFVPVPFADGHARAERRHAISPPPSVNQAYFEMARGVLAGLVWDDAPADLRDRIRAGERIDSFETGALT